MSEDVPNVRNPNDCEEKAYKLDLRAGIPETAKDYRKAMAVSKYF